MRFPGLLSIVRNSAYLLGGQAASILARLVYVVILVRWLEPSDYGTLNYALSWYLSFIAFTYLGLEVVLSREIGRDRTAAASLAGATLLVRTIAIFGVTSIYFLTAFLIGSDGSTMQLLLILSVALAGRSIWLWSSSLFTALEDARLVMRVDLVSRPLEIVLVLLYFTLFGVDLLGIAAIHALSWSVQGAAGVAFALKATSLHFEGARRRIPALIAAGFPGFLFALAMTLFLQLPIVLVGHGSGSPDGYGQFVLAFQLVGYFQIVPSVIAGAALPILTRSALRSDGKDRKLGLAFLLLVPALGLAAGVAAIWLAEPLVRLMFGPRYAPAAEILVQAVWLVIPFSLATLLQQFLFSREARLGLGSLAPILGASAMALLLRPMTEVWGYSGAIAAAMLGMSLWLAVLVTALARFGFFLPSRRQATL